MTIVPQKSGEAFGVLTDDAFARSRLRLGVPRPQQNKPHNYEVTWDGVRHFAYGYGDVLLPSRDAAVTLPEPPAVTVDGMLEYELGRYGVGGS